MMKWLPILCILPKETSRDENAGNTAYGISATS